MPLHGLDFSQAGFGHNPPIFEKIGFFGRFLGRFWAPSEGSWEAKMAKMGENRPHNSIFRSCVMVLGVVWDVFGICLGSGWGCF